MKKLFVLCCVVCLQIVTAQNKFTVYFDTDKYELSEPQVDSLANWIKQNRSSKIISMHGFTDQVGTVIYNDTLSQKRVQNMYHLLKPYLQIRDDFELQSFGKNHDLEKDQAKNRRVDIFYLKEDELALENQILGIQRQPISPHATLAEKVNNAWVGDKIELPNIYFRIDTFAMLPQSKPIMDELANILLQNPNLVIEVQGHICCQPRDTRDLSTQRAKQIKRVLMRYGVKEHQVRFKGLGSTQPRFTIPEQSEAERAANRRVEIEIIKN
ncbi:OmpA family protein [Flavobacterium agricola]|uniref:OmpA family protein n=1 Tax=Flavobacterium agricola TaxID=2870839 RepID=A0ABY6LYU6_9FLAO|nr:OmpA family protein [Flavobacterium agricola]UYW01503.1 OmpA family protein [Flavobacterium agricola]